MPGGATAVHDWFIGTLWRIASIKTIKLVARICDQRLNNDDNNSLFVFLPDTHLVSRHRIGTQYNSGFNHERMYVDLAKTLRSARRNNESYQVEVVHLGDFVDLWKEDSTDPLPVLSEYQGVRDYLYGLGERRSAGCNFLIGNHDADFARIPHLTSRWHYRMFLPKSNPTIYATHGDVFDWLERLPDNLQRWAVYHFSPGTRKPNTNLDQLIELRKHHSVPADPAHLSQLGAPSPLALDELQRRVNVQNNHKFLDKCHSRVAKMNSDYQLNISVAVIGHTHNAQISAIDDGTELFVLMDCGAWIGSYSESDSSIKANAQIGVICGNDCRIYQLDADTEISPQFEDAMVL